MDEFNISKLEIEDSRSHEIIYRAKDLKGRKGLIEFITFVLKKYGENYLKNMDDVAAVYKQWDQDIIDGLKKITGKK